MDHFRLVKVILPRLNFHKYSLIFILFLCVFKKNINFMGKNWRVISFFQIGHFFRLDGIHEGLFFFNQITK